ncbi:MAG: plastocyanin/azurin family copper-binding protein [Gemmatimonadota bacterium]|nr:plastocyanin/azurin family copper-binding protein [Gemmatimonadota bacterium]
MRTRILLSALLIVVAAAACSDSTAPANPNGVNVADNSFSPGVRTVALNTTVTWTWTGGSQHNVTWTAGSPAASTTQSSGTYQRSFDTAGTFDYYCSIHGTPTTGMRGSVTVQ